MANTSIRVDTVGLGIAWALGETYRVQIDQGFLTQEGGLQLPLSGGNITTFTTPSNPPTVRSTYPANNETASQENQTITIAVDRANIVGLSGNVYLYKRATPNVLIATYRVNSNAAVSANTTAVGLGYYNNTDTISGNIITIPVHHYLTANTSYFVRTDANIIQDLNGYKFTAISSNTAFAWTTSTDWQKDLSSVPTVTYDEDTIKVIRTPTIVNDINDLIGYENSSYTLAITSDTNVGIRSLTINSTNWTNNTHTLTGNASSINNQLANVVLTPADDGTDPVVLNYSLTTPPGNVYTRTQTIPCAVTNSESANLAVSRGYYFNSNTAIFATSPIQVDDNGVSSADTYSITISTATRAIGGLGYAGNTNPAYSLTITGNKSYVNSQISLVKYFPDLNYTSNTSIYYTQIRNGRTQIIEEIPLTYLGNTTLNWANTTYSLTSTQTINFDPDVVLYGNIDYVLVGGGGGGTTGGVYGDKDGGIMGLGGQVIEVLNYKPNTNSYLITIGAGGSAGVGGDTTSGFGNTAVGGSTSSFVSRSSPSLGSGWSEWYVVGNGPGGNGTIWANYYQISTFDNSSPNGNPPCVQQVPPNYYQAGSENNTACNTYWEFGFRSSLTGEIYSARPYSPNQTSPSTVQALWKAISETGTHRPAIPAGKYGWGGHGGWTHPSSNGSGKLGSQGFAYARIKQVTGTWTLIPETPAAPTIGSASIIGYTSYSNVSISVSFTAPTDNGGAEITSYTAVSSPDSISANINQSGSGSITISGLNVGTAYTFRVYAKNSVGNSDFSNYSNSIAQYAIPSTPTIGSAYLLSNTTANVSYTASTNNGGYAITNYTAISTPGNITGTLSTSGSGNITVTGLTANTWYNFSVYATTSYGNSNVSISTNAIGGSVAPPTSLLLHFDGTMGSNVFTDSSVNNYVFVRGSDSAGAANITTAKARFGTGSLTSLGTGDQNPNRGLYLAGTKPTPLNLQSTDFTIEWWADYADTVSYGDPAIAGVYGTGQACFHIIAVPTYQNIFEIEFSPLGSYATPNGYVAVDFTNTVWNQGFRHYAVVKQGTEIKMFANGNALSGTVVSSGAQGKTPATYFANGSPASGAGVSGTEGIAIADGWLYGDQGLRRAFMDELRISTVARYTANFSPSTSAFNSLE